MSVFFIQLHLSVLSVKLDLWNKEKLYRLWNELFDSACAYIQ